MDAADVIVGAVATVLAALVAGITGRATARASAKGAVQAAAVTSLAELERESGQRAFAYWKGVVEDQRREHDEDRAEIAAMKAAQARDHAVIADQQAQIEALTRQVRECKELCRRLVRRDDPPPPFDLPSDFTD